ncbi:MAG: CHAT domain-containing protein [Clostridium sp.]|uniref:CHAT domain-containing protein n=1 Tax=Clostridium sp. TaxID=1506 RepID=UPI003D6C7CAB
MKKLKKNLLNLSKYSRERSEVAYKSCEYIEIHGINVDNLYALESASNELLNIMPTEEYKIQIEITEQIVSLMNYWYINVHDKDEKDFIAQYFFTLENYYNIAWLLAMLGIFGLSWDYLMKGIRPNYREKGLELDKGITYSIWKLGIETIPQARRVIMEVCSCYFYLGRILGHNYEECYGIYKSTKKWLKIGREAINGDIGYLCFACSLFNPHNNQEMHEITDTLTDQYYIEVSRNKEGALQICYTLHSVNTISNEIKIKWAVNGVNILDDLKSTNIESRVVLESTILLNESNFKKTKIKNIIIEYLKYLENTISDSTIRGFQKQKMSVIINKCILFSIEHNEHEFAAECAYIWRTYPHNIEGNFKSEEILLIIFSNFKTDMITYLIYLNNKCILLEFPKKISLRKLIDSKNDFEGNWTVITGENSDENFNYNGYSNENLANTYNENLEQFYCISEIVEKIKLIKDISKINIIEIPWVNVPMESLIGIHWDKSISTLVSGNPKEQRVIKNILIWCDPDCSLPSTIIEKELIENNLINCEGVNANIFIGEECSYELFCEKYKDGNYDMIWLMCHGNFDFDNPSNSCLYISKDKPIAINELIDLIPHTDQRRLLVINACESGCSSVRSSGMNFVGFGASLSNQFQSVIGHLWPIDSFAASVFGAILSHNILCNNDWGKAINNTRKQMNDGNKAIEEFFKITLKYEENSEIVQRLNRCSQEMNELIFWGSSAFFK